MSRRTTILLLSNRLWRERYAADPGIIDRDIRMDGRPFTVVGVLPPGPVRSPPGGPLDAADVLRLKRGTITPRACC